MKALVLACACFLACGGGKAAKSTAAPDARPMDESPAAEPSKPRKNKGKPEPKPAPVLPTTPPKTDEADLQVEEQESNPNSETVTLRVSISPPAKGVVMWGQKLMARFAPGTMEVELTRPRGSGPLDLELRAEGFLVHHTRLFADRSDKTNVRLYRAEDAVGLHGYKPPTPPK